MSLGHQYALSRRGFCICCAVATGFIATRGWLSPSQSYAEARNIVDLIRDEAAKTSIKVHRLRGKVSVLEGSGGNVAVLTGGDGKVTITANKTKSSGVATFTITDVSASGYVYNPALNNETSDSITLP